MPKRTAWCAVLAAVVLVVCVLFGRTSSRAPFGYDEADYMYAGRQGFWANYSDRNSLSLVTFVQKGLELARDDTQRFAVSEYVRASDDIAFYRHYHGPVYAYWISAWHALGVRQEASFRATGLVVHAVLAMTIFWLFLRLFPGLPVEAAFVAGIVFAMNRTALVTATSITQHLMFEASSCLALFATAEFLRTRRARYWYAAAVLMAVSFAAVEIAVVLIAALAATVAAFEWRHGWKPLLALMARGAAWFVVTAAVLWPKGVFELNALKGYLYLAYIAIYRKTFSPISPVELWGFKLTNYPFEFVLLGIVLASALWWFWRSTHRDAMAPFLSYGCIFLTVTLIITVPYTYYHSSLITALAVLTGVMFGELWNRSGGLVRWATLALVVGSLVALDTEYYRERVVERSSSTLSAQVLSYLNAGPSSPATVFVPQTLVPALHYYRPEIVAVGYEDGDPRGTQQLAQRFVGQAGAKVFCVEPMCRQFEAFSRPGAWVRKEPLGLIPGTADMLYVGIVNTP